MSIKKVNVKVSLFLVLLCSFLLAPLDEFASVNFVQLTPDSPTTLSNGKPYYLAGIQYDFSIHAIDPDITAWSGVNQVQLTVPNLTAVVLRTGALSGTVSGAAATVVSGGVSATYDVAGTYNNFTVTFHVTVLWTTPESVYTSSRSVVGTVTTSSTLSSTVLLSYGFCSSIVALNFVLGGDAADAMLSRYHQAFTAGADAICYNVPGATASDGLSVVDPGEMSSVNLLFDANPVGSDSTYPAISITTADSQLSVLGYTYSTTPVSTRFRVNMSTGGALESCQNSVSLTCNEIEVSDYGFTSGGGVSSSPSYIRSTVVSGTIAFVNIRMLAGGAAPAGAVTVVLRDVTDGTLTSINVADGVGSGSDNLTYPAIAAGTTVSHTYEVYNIYGGSYGSSSGYGQYANNSARITQPVNRVIKWENADPPGNNASAFLNGTLTGVATATTITLNWDTTALTADDDDLYSYQIYFKKSSASVYTIIDKTTAGYAALGLRGTSSAVITALDYLTDYDIILSAVDLFGHEVSSANRISLSIHTLASQMTAGVSDGITVYEDSVFSADTPLLRPLRPVAIRVGLYIVTSGELPDELNIIAAPYAVSDMVTSGSLNGTEGVDYYRLSTYRIGPNNWQTFIPSGSPLIYSGAQIRFIVESVKSGTRSYADYDNEIELAPGDPNNFEWTFSIRAQTVNVPWPARILNNVINKKNPVAYPAYYLSEDGFVTITVYDAKGRPLYRLLDGASRKGGVNIKEGGWSARNNKGNRVGPGLYYIMIKAKSSSTGKMILNETRKVVVSE